MSLLSGKNKSHRPKFLLNLRIDELINIPQSSGYCYVKWNLKEGTGSTIHRLRNSSEDENDKIGHQSHGLTPRVPVENHRARWNYQLDKPIQVKLQVDKTRNLEAKRLVLEIYFEFLDQNAQNNPERIAQKPKKTSLDAPNVVRSSNNVYSPKVVGKLQLGTVSLNLAEYVRENEQPITNRFLLKKSKVNSIINVTVQMKLIRGTYEDFLISKASGSQAANGMRLGIDDILDDNSEKSSPVSSTFQGSAGGSPRSNNQGRSVRGSSRLGSGTYANGGAGAGSKGQSYMGMGSPSMHGNTISSSMNPLVENLYQKTFQLPWDPRPSEFTPKECVEDILQGGNGWARNEKGISLIDIQALKLVEVELEYQENQRYGANEKMNAAKKMENNTSADEYNAMDKKEFLEKMHSRSSAAQNQTKIIKDENKRGNAITEDGEGQLEDFNAEQIKDAKSWTINRIPA